MAWDRIKVWLDESSACSGREEQLRGVVGEHEEFERLEFLNELRVIGGGEANHSEIVSRRESLASGVHWDGWGSSERFV